MKEIEKVMHWRRAFGLPSAKTHGQVNEDRANLHQDLLEEEAFETVQAIGANDIKEIKDGLADVFFILVGIADEYGIDLSDCIDKVYESNMSKLCCSKEEAEATVKAYAEGTHPSKLGEKIPAYYSREINTMAFVVKRISDHKVLKSINFKEPVF